MASDINWKGTQEGQLQDAKEYGDLGDIFEQDFDWINGELIPVTPLTCNGKPLTKEQEEKASKLMIQCNEIVTNVYKDK